MHSPQLILVTGASGQVGSALARLANERGSHVLALGRRELDVADREQVEAVLGEVRPAAVANCAAYTDVDGAEDHPDEARAVNALGPGYLAGTCREAGIPLIHISTDYVFDGTADRPYGEDASPNPINVYGRTKLEGEEAVRAELDRHLIVRTSWVFAPEHRNFVTTILRLARDREELRVVEDQRGSPTPAAALAEVLFELAGRAATGENLPWGTYHLAGEPPASRYELAEAAIEAARAAGAELACRRTVPVAGTEFPTRALRPTYTALDSSRAREVLGVGRIGWREGLNEIAGR